MEDTKLPPKEEKLPVGVALNEEIPYVRVGCIYYKRVIETDRYGITKVKYKVWKKEEIVQDHGKDYLKQIPLYDDWVMKPDNLSFEPIINGCLNLYSEFQHKPQEGEWTWTDRLLKHVFGDQYDLGLRYLQILYLFPNKSTIILVLVSTERGTGKTTFLNWINMLFGSNVAMITPSDFTGHFNSHYASKNIIAIEESFFEKQLTIEKLKALATAKILQIHEKFGTPYNIPFYGKIILTSNNEDKFAKVDQEEIRFFVRKLEKPERDETYIESYLKKEIPAFLHYLNSLPPIDWRVSRSGFSTEELKNSSLDAVVRESKSGLCKDLEIRIADHFYNMEIDSFYATPVDIKSKWFQYDNNISLSYVRSVLRKEIKMLPEGMTRYAPFGEDLQTRSGTPYLFHRKDFVKM